MRFFSSAHKANIIDLKATHMGVAWAGPYWTQELARDEAYAQTPLSEIDTGCGSSTPATTAPTFAIESIMKTDPTPDGIGLTLNAQANANDLKAQYPTTPQLSGDYAMLGTKPINPSKRCSKRRREKRSKRSQIQ